MPENTPNVPELPPEPYVELYRDYRAEMLQLPENALRVLIVAAMDELEVRKADEARITAELRQAQQRRRFASN
jgi:hypothetical protein